ncbi:hypothetical protein GCM10007164_05430 [Luteimonas padinae]|nr:hypothetical protein GCM10007164_05430 [Luteimonas padinae]
MRGRKAALRRLLGGDRRNQSGAQQDGCCERNKTCKENPHRPLPVAGPTPAVGWRVTGVTAMLGVDSGFVKLHRRDARVAGRGAGPRATAPGGGSAGKDAAQEHQRGLPGLGANGG